MTSSPFFSQNTWLKLFIFLLVLPAAILALPRHLGLQIGLFLLYFLLQAPLYHKLLFALRKILPFFTAYWLFGTLFSLDFIELLIFSLRLLLLVFGTVYFFGSLSFTALLGDTRRLRTLPWAQNAFHFIVATMLFIHNYSRLFKEHKIEGKASVSEIIAMLAGIMKQNLAQAPDIEHKAQSLMQSKFIAHDPVSGSNLLGLAYICLSMLLYSL